MKKTCLLGIDIGTSGCKSLLIDEAGKVLASSLAGYPLYTPRPGWAEQDPEDWWKATVWTVGQILRESGVDPGSISGIGLSGQMHGMVPLDEKRRVVRPAILWNDQRTAEQCQQITEAAGGEERLMGYTNNLMLPGYTGGKILWLRQNEPERYRRVRTVLNPKDYIRFRLTGEIATEVSDASGTGLFDVRNRRWSERLLSMLDIPLGLLPTCFESDQVTGRITGPASHETGLPEGVPVVGGGGDAVIQTTGMGIVREGRLGITIGTAGIVAMGLERFRSNPGGRLQLFCGNSADAWHVMGVTLAAGGSYQWYKNTLCEGEGLRAANAGKDVYELLDGDVSSSPPGARGLLFLPYLSGERCPYTDPLARGSFVGLNLLHRKADITRAVMEGITYSLYDVVELIQLLDKDMTFTSITASGGGSKSPVWRQVLADVFQLPVRTVSGSSEGGAYGAAMVAGVGCGVWGSLDEGIAVLRVETETTPNPGVRDTYAALFEVYRGLYPALRSTFEKLAAHGV